MPQRVPWKFRGFQERFTTVLGSPLRFYENSMGFQRASMIFWESYCGFRGFQEHSRAFQGCTRGFQRHSEGVTEGLMGFQKRFRGDPQDFLSVPRNFSDVPEGFRTLCVFHRNSTRGVFQRISGEYHGFQEPPISDPGYFKGVSDVFRDCAMHGISGGFKSALGFSKEFQGHLRAVI